MVCFRQEQLSEFLPVPSFDDVCAEPRGKNKQVLDKKKKLNVHEDSLSLPKKTLQPSDKTAFSHKSRSQRGFSPREPPLGQIL